MKLSILFFCHYFPPEGNAPASRTYEHCVRWVAAGHKVTVITCVPNVPNGIVYGGYKNRVLPQREVINGVNVLRVWSFVAPNAGSTKRIINYLSYMFSAVFAAVFWCARPNVIIATSPQFFCGWAGVISSWVKRCPLVLEIRDIWPESIVTVGAMQKSIVIRLLESLEKWMYKSANHIITVGNGYRDNILSKVGMIDRVSVVTNGVDTNQFTPRAKSSEFIRSWRLENKFVCAYIGTIGMAHGLEIVIDAARVLMNSGQHDICFLMVGDGACKTALQRLTDESNLCDMIQFTGLLPKSEIGKALSSCDCVLVHLKKSLLFETVIPSKLFEAMAMKKPVILGVRGESADIVRQADCGVIIEPEDASGLVDAVCRLKNDAIFYRTLCINGPRVVFDSYSRDQLATKALEILMQASQYMTTT